MANLYVYLNTLRQKGNLAYEYNPLYNYQTDVDLYIVDNKYIIPQGQAINTKNGELLVFKENQWIDKRGRKITSNIKTASQGTLWAKAGSLVDLDTDQLNFDLEHPVDIQVQPSYDGSVNLILNDDKNIPRLINSRFSVREKGTYEIVDRIGENDTNVYNSNTFDKDTSLYFQYEYNPTVSYQGFLKGVLPVGQYCFYFTYCDADDNESDYIAESGLIPAFIGSDREPSSIDGGIKNQISNKGIKLKIENLDKSYNYLKVYYVRYFADYQQNRVYECKKIYRKYPINSGTLYLQITGNEEAEDLDPNVLNLSRFNPKSVLTQAQCKNMLFFGNIVKNVDNYKELTDCALRIIPELKNNTLDVVDNNYNSINSSFGYYDSLNMYNKVGYFNQEYYRFGVVFIYQNGTLSNVYNTLGGDLTGGSDSIKQTDNNLYSSELGGTLLVREYIQSDDFGWVKSSSTNVFSGKNLNSRGVCHINYSGNIHDNTIFGIKFNIPENVVKHLKEDLKIRGLFFVRQKCVPNILAQCYILPMDDLLDAPIIKSGNKYYTETFLNQKTREVTNEYKNRLYEYADNSESSISSNSYAGICPDFLLNQPYYNQIFNGNKFRLEEVVTRDLTNEERFYKAGGVTPNSSYSPNSSFQQVTISTVTDDVSTVALNDKVFRLQVGQMEESYRFSYAEYDTGTYSAGTEDFSKINEQTNLVRSQYSPYLAIYSSTKLKYNTIYNIYQDNVFNSTQEYRNRMDSSEPFYSISDRFNFEGLADESSVKSTICYRGDCYLNTFTYRLNRNFNDPSLPNNDKIIDKNTWKDNYDAADPTKWEDISRSDLNAVQMGSWITFRVRSAMNYALRSVDHSYVSEEALMGSPRSFYPRSRLLYRGENKLPDSYLYNDAYRASLGYKCYFTLQDINYIKDTYSNRIQYSAIAIQDSFKNNYRYSLSTYFRDYSQEYGSITKLVEVDGNLLVVFEHGIGIATVNERVLTGTGEGGPVFINSNNVLSEELLIVTNTFGSQWPESIIKSESGYVYGVDTVTKKIWRVIGQNVEILSDFKVNKFLIDNISLGERELYPIIGLKNVKTHYNNNKKDIMFTFYDDIYQDEEKVWNLCYNEIYNKFITFYSWIPSYSENIDTQYFSFNRDTAKNLSLLYKSNYSIPENFGVLLDTPVFSSINDYSNLYYSSPDKYSNVTILNSDGTTSQISIECNQDNNGQYILGNIRFKLEKDHWGNYNLFDEISLSNGRLEIKSSLRNQATGIFNVQKVILLYITPYFEQQDYSRVLPDTFERTTFKTEAVGITLSNILNNPLLTSDERNRAGLTTDFYLHGQAGIFNVIEDLYPTHWYGRFHPFEFEFVVNDKIGQQKIFNNLMIISNKAEPESFHFEIEGDNYEFSEDKRAMYFRQEATKELYQSLGSDIIFNRKYSDVTADNYTYEQYYRALEQENPRIVSDDDEYVNKKYGYSKIDKVYPLYSHGLKQQKKSTIFPLYYERVDTYNDIYHKYHMMHDDDGVYDFENLSGSEISWNRDLNQFNIITHIKNRPIDHVGRLRGNSRYNEGKWNIQIPSISFTQSNEEPWSNNIPPIVINSSYVPKDLTSSKISADKIPNIYTRIDRTNGQTNPITDYIKMGDWTYRKEACIRDKWIKIRVRYSGKNLAIIHSLITLYNVSYS